MWPKKLKFTTYKVPSDAMFVEPVGDVPQLPVVMPGTGTPTTVMTWDQLLDTIEAAERPRYYRKFYGSWVELHREDYEALVSHLPTVGGNAELLRLD
jgi:hypothetical protein